MDKSTLRSAVVRLNASEIGPENSSYAHKQAAQQYNALLRAAKELYPNRYDIQALTDYGDLYTIGKAELRDAVSRLYAALVDMPLSSTAELLELLTLPTDAPADLERDLTELHVAVALELPKSGLLLAGSIAEALLLSRHPDTSEKGPGLKKMVEQASTQRLFGRDTERALESLIDYRDVIHTRAEARNKTTRNMARLDAAVTALKLLCSDLADLNIRFS